MNPAVRPYTASGASRRRRSRTTRRVDGAGESRRAAVVDEEPAAPARSAAVATNASTVPPRVGADVDERASRVLRAGRRADSARARQREIRATGALRPGVPEPGAARPGMPQVTPSRLSGAPDPPPRSTHASERPRPRAPPSLSRRPRPPHRRRIGRRACEGVLGAARQVDARDRRRHALAGGLPQRRLPGLHRLRLRDPQPRRARDVHDAPGVEPALAEVRPPRLPPHLPGQGRVRPGLLRAPAPRVDGRRGGQRRRGARVHRAPRHDRHEGAGRTGRHRRAPLPRGRRSTTGTSSTGGCSRAASCSSKRSSCSIPISRPSAPAP